MSKKILSKWILPQTRVDKQYKNYLGWSFASNFLISAESVLCTHSMFSTLGCHPAWAFSYNFIGKDVFGQLGGLMYINKFGKEFDKNPRQFVVHANVFQQGSIFLECMTPLISSTIFLPIAVVASIGKNISWINFASVNTKCISKLAIKDNIAEIYSRISVFNTFASSAGMVAGLAIAYCIPSHLIRLCTIMPVLCILRIYCYNRAIENLL